MKMESPATASPLVPLSFMARDCSALKPVRQRMLTEAMGLKTGWTRQVMVRSVAAVGSAGEKESREMTGPGLAAPLELTVPGVGTVR